MNGVAPPDILTCADGATIAYRRTPGRSPGVVFLPGYRSDMQGGKALALEERCRAEGRAFLRFDYTGHGESSGTFEDGTIGRWAEDAVAAIDAATEGPQVLVGSSMGGWVMLLAALARKDRVAGLVGIAAAPDFTEDLMWEEMPAPLRRELEEKRVIYEPSPYSEEPTPVMMGLIEEGRNRLLLRGDGVALDCPVRLLQGMADPDVPWQTAMRLMEQLVSDDVELTLIKRGDHRLSTDQYLTRLCDTVSTLCREIEAA